MGARMSGPIVVGIDLSLTGTGVSRSNRPVRLVESTGAKAASLDERFLRLVALHVKIFDATWVDRKPDLVVIEAPAYASKLGSMHDRSGLWWILVRELRESLVPVVEVTPSGRAKYATGKGNASKDVVLAEVVRRFPGYTGSNNNTADAYVLMAMGLDHLGHPLVDMPQTHRVALDAVKWPA